MALAISSLAANPSTSNATSYTSSSVTPAANAGIIVCIANSRGSVPALPSLDAPTWQSGSWTQEATLVNVADNSRMTLFSGRSGASPGADTLAASFGASTQTGCEIIIVQATDEDETDFLLQPAIQDFATATSGSKALAGALAAATSACLAFFYDHQNTSHAPTGGETEIADITRSTPTRCLSCQFEINDTTSSASWTNTSVHLIGVMEIKEVAVAAAAVPRHPAINHQNPALLMEGWVRDKLTDSWKRPKLVLFRVGRLPMDGSDTLVVDAMLLGMMITYTRT